MEMLIIIGNSVLETGQSVGRAVRWTARAEIENILAMITWV